MDSLRFGTRRRVPNLMKYDECRVTVISIGLLLLLLLGA